MIECVISPTCNFATAIFSFMLVNKWIDIDAIEWNTAHFLKVIIFSLLGAYWLVQGIYQIYDNCVHDKY